MAGVAKKKRINFGPWC